MVSIMELVEEMNICNDDTGYFLDKNTGEIIYLNDESMYIARKINLENKDLSKYPKWQQDEINIALDIFSDLKARYIHMPKKHELKEYSILQEFCKSLDDKNIGEIILEKITGLNSTSSYDDVLIDYDLEDLWEDYKDDAFKRYAVEWCEKNNILWEE